jgi:hypothetical protein
MAMSTAAHANDEAAYRRLAEPHRDELQCKLIDARRLANAIDLITLHGREIADATAFLSPALFEVFGLPLEPADR